MGASTKVARGRSVPPATNASIRGSYLVGDGATESLDGGGASHAARRGVARRGPRWGRGVGPSPGASSWARGRSPRGDVPAPECAAAMGGVGVCDTGISAHVCDRAAGVVVRARGRGLGGGTKSQKGTGVGRCAAIVPWIRGCCVVTAIVRLCWGCSKVMIHLVRSVPVTKSLQ